MQSATTTETKMAMSSKYPLLSQEAPGSVDSSIDVESEDIQDLSVMART
jgi:hypothetical protein